MNGTFNADEALEIAVNIERNGQAFYRRAAELVNDAGAERLLLDLADWEAEHERTFTALREAWAEQRADEALLDPNHEAGRYLKAVADSKVFDTHADDADILSQAVDIRAILDYALKREKDTVLFFVSLSIMTPKNLGRDDVDKIIREELGHINFINTYLKRNNLC